MRKKTVLIILLPVCIGIIVTVACYLNLKINFGYSPESLSDFIYNVRNQPHYYFVRQGVAYHELENGIVLRTDEVRVGNGDTMICESYGIPGLAGTYFFTNHDAGIEIDKHTSTRYKYNDDGTLIGKIVYESEMYYFNLGKYHMFFVCSDGDDVSDSSNSPSVTIQRASKYFTYVFPAELSDDYKITCHNYTVTGASILFQIQEAEVYN